MVAEPPGSPSLQASLLRIWKLSSSESKPHFSSKRKCGVSHRADLGQGWKEIPGAAVDSQNCQQKAGAAGFNLARTAELAQRGHVPLHQGSILEALALAPLFHCPQEAGFRKNITAGVLKGAFSQLLWSSARVYGMPRV